MSTFVKGAERPVRVRRSDVTGLIVHGEVTSHIKKFMLALRTNGRNNQRAKSRFHILDVKMLH